ncbi:helix-turn-helix domain-containing protein [Nocardia sp. NPDC052566]|uniref:helix-turn-helix domain-containing protein n=1 Tax=Nocardia sp. NPDC052566 TaxID=3364330 RepID=UPI0037C8A00B
MADQRSPIGKYIRERREASGLTRQQLADRTKLSLSLIEKVELGSREPTINALGHLFDALLVPIPYRKHVLTLTMPNMFENSMGPGPGVPTPDDITDLESLGHPACLQKMPSYDLVAVNAAFARTFPGLGAGSNVIEWMFLDPVAKTVMTEWHKEAHLMVFAFRMLAPGLVPTSRVAEIAERCRAAPEWNYMWTAEVPPEHIVRDRVLIQDPVSKQIRRMIMRLYSPEFPTRPWWLYRVIPAG